MMVNKPGRKRHSTNKNTSSEVIIDLKRPILKPKSWSFFILLLGIVLALYPLFWILLLHNQSKVDDFKIFHWILHMTSNLTSSFFTVVIAAYCLFVGWISMKNDLSYN